MKRFQDTAEAQEFLDKLISMANDERLAEYLQATDRNFDTNTEEGLHTLKRVLHKLAVDVSLAQ